MNDELTEWKIIFEELETEKVLLESVIPV